MKSNPFAILGRSKDDGDGDQDGGEGSCGSSGEGTCGGHSTPSTPSTPTTPTNPTAGREDAPQFPGTLGVAPSTQALDIAPLAALMAKKMAPQGALVLDGQQPLPAQSDRSRDNYLRGMDRTWR